MRGAVAPAVAKRDAAHAASMDPNAAYSSPSVAWSDHVRVTLGQIFDRLVHEAGLPVPARPFAICFCGSLAYGEGSFHSDIDSFAILEDAADQPAMYELGRHALRWLVKVHERGHLLTPDAEIFPSAMADTIHELLTGEKYVGQTNWIPMVRNAAFVYGTKALFDQFKLQASRLNAETDVQRQETAIAEMEEAVMNFAEPLWGNRSVQMKDEIYRTLSLIIGALGRFHGLTPGAGVVSIADTLVQDGHMSQPVKNLVHDAWRNFEAARNSLHVRMGAEYYKLARYNPRPRTVARAALPQPAKPLPQPRAYSGNPPSQNTAWLATKQEEVWLNQAVECVKMIRRIARSFIATYYGDEDPGYHDAMNFKCADPRATYLPADDSRTWNFQKGRTKRTASMHRAEARVLAVQKKYRNE